MHDVRSKTLQDPACAHLSQPGDAGWWKSLSYTYTVIRIFPREQKSGEDGQEMRRGAKHEQEKERRGGCPPTDQ